MPLVPELRRAVASKRYEKVREILQENPSLANSFTSAQRKVSWLEYAISDDNRQLFDLLLEFHARPDLVNASGYTALHICALSGNAHFIEPLVVQHGANVDAANSRGFTPLFWAIERENLQMMEILLKLGASPVSKSFFARIRNKTKALDMLRLLLKAGLPVNSAPFSGSVPPLVAATLMNDSLDVINELVLHGANVNAGSDVLKPLHGAVLKDDADLIRLFLCNQANAKVENQEGLTPFLLGQRLGHTNSCYVLLQENPMECLAELGEYVRTG